MVTHHVWKVLSYRGVDFLGQTTCILLGSVGNTSFSVFVGVILNLFHFCQVLLIFVLRGVFESHVGYIANGRTDGIVRVRIVVQTVVR